MIRAGEWGVELARLLCIKLNPSTVLFQHYLLGWAEETGVPILSIDYSLAPEHRFPRQIEEVFFAYCWALKNAASLGVFVY